MKPPADSNRPPRPPARSRLTIPLVNPEARRRQRRTFRQASRGQILFGVIALVAVCSLVGSTLATVGLNLGSRQSATSTVDATRAADAQSALIADQRKTVAANPNDANAMAMLAQYLQVTNNSAEAIEWYTKALQINPNDVKIRLDFADMLVNTNRQGDAELQYQRVLQIDPNNLQAMFWLGDLYQYWKPSPRTGEAVAFFERVLQVGPGSVPAQQAQQRLAQLGVATPAAGTPAVPMPGTPIATPATPIAGTERGA